MVLCVDFAFEKNESVMKQRPGVSTLAELS